MAEKHGTTPVPDTVKAQSSSFSGKTIQLIAWRLLGVLLSIVTFGIAAPWAHCMILRWETKHTFVNGKRLYFDGKGGQLFGKSLLWGLLLIVTFGIYGLFLPVRMHKWRVSHTRFARETDDLSGPSGGKIALMIIAGVLAAALLIAGLAFFLQRPIAAPDMPSGQSGLLGGLIGGIFGQGDDNISLRPGHKDELPAAPTVDDPQPPTIDIVPTPSAEEVTADSILGTWSGFTFSDDRSKLYQDVSYGFLEDGTYFVSSGESYYTYSAEEGLRSMGTGSDYYEGTYYLDGNTLSLGNGRSFQVRLEGNVLYLDERPFYQGDSYQIALELFTQS